MRPNPRPPRWPFWLLLAAWLCANSPQVAVYATLSWLAEARTFSHQQRLTSEVAHLLTGERAPGLLAQAERELPVSSLPAIPAETVLKKFPLAIEGRVQVLPPELRSGRPDEATEVCPDALGAPPPHGPPRGSWV